MTSAERDKLRQVIRRAESLRAMITPDAALQQLLDRIDQRCARLRITAARSNRAKGALRQAIQQRQAALELHQRHRDRAAAAAAAAADATELLLRDAGDLGDVARQARDHLAAMVAAGQQLRPDATLAERVSAEAAIIEARQRHAAALAAAVAWDPSEAPQQRRA